MAPDTNHGAAAVDTHGLIVRAEVASEVVNRARARALLLARIYEIEDRQDTASLDEVARLEARERDLFIVLRSLDHRDNGHVEEVIARLGSLVKDESRFWAEMNSAV